VDLKGLSLGREDGGTGAAAASLLSHLLSCAGQSHRTLDMLCPGRVCRNVDRGEGKPYPICSSPRFGEICTSWPWEITSGSCHGARDRLLSHSTLAKADQGP